MGEQQSDGSISWRQSERGVGYPLQVPAECPGGWQHSGVDLVAARVADYLMCSDEPRPEFWIDRETGLVLRTQEPGDPMTGTMINEVISLTLTEPPPGLFEPPT